MAGTVAQLLRPVGAVPGTVTAAASTGCHRLLREGAASVVAHAAEVAELVTVAGRALAPEPVTEVRAVDGLDPMGRRTLDALPVRRAVPAAAVAREAGLTLDETQAVLGLLELAALAVREEGRWRR